MEPDKIVTVIDHGSDTIKAGIGNYPERGPQLVCGENHSHSHSARQESSKQLNSIACVCSQIIPSLVTPLDDGASMDIEADPEKMLHPFRHGMVQDWEMVESIYNYMLYEQAWEARHLPRPRKHAPSAPCSPLQPASLAFLRSSAGNLEKAAGCFSPSRLSHRRRGRSASRSSPPPSAPPHPCLLLLSSLLRAPDPAATAPPRRKIRSSSRR